MPVWGTMQDPKEQLGTASEYNDIDAPEADTNIDLNQELDQLRHAMGELKEQALRDRADIENQRRRLARDLEMARKYANERLLADLLPVFDSVHAGLKAAGDQPHPLKEGLELTLKQLNKFATDNGLVELDPKGDVFNPDVHQAVSQYAAEGIAAGTVVDVFQRGYVLNERLLRPALVVVAAES